MKKQIQDQVLVKNRSYEFKMTGDASIKGKLKALQYTNSKGEEDFDVAIVLEGGNIIHLHCTDEVEVSELEKA
jgi:hypothetical protein